MYAQYSPVLTWRSSAAPASGSGSAIAKLAEALPEAGAALDRHVRTGLYCAYEPADGDLRWIVQS